MNNKDTAKIVQKAFKPLLKATSWKATCGSNKAASDLLKQMTAYNFVLRQLGYMDDDEGRIVKFKPIQLPDYVAEIINSKTSLK